jgi:hypothetical protein
VSSLERWRVAKGINGINARNALNDALIFLTAIKAGLPGLTANRDKFELIQQLVPQGQLIYF